MDKQNTPSGSKRSRARPANLSTAGSYIPQMPSPPGAYHQQGMSPTGAYHHQHGMSPTGPYHHPHGMSPTGAYQNQQGNWAFLNLMSQQPIISYGQQQQQQQQQQQPYEHDWAYQPRDTQQSSSEENDDDTDVIPETQPQPSPPPQPSKPTRKSRSQKGKKPAGTGRTPCNPWKPDEETELAKAWAETSEDSVTANFWMSVKMNFDNRMGFNPEYRSIDAVMSKVKQLLPAVSKFASVFNNISNHRKSGENDLDVLIRARKRYREENGKNFPLEHAWEVLKVSPKFRPVEMLDPANIHAPKRSKTSETASPGSSDARTYVNVEDTTERTRPLGRNAARRAAAGSSSSMAGGFSDTMTALLDQISTYNSSNQAFMDTARMNAEVRQARQEREDLRFYLEPHDHLTGGSLDTMLIAKEKLRQKYGWAPLE